MHTNTWLVYNFLSKDYNKNVFILLPNLWTQYLSQFVYRTITNFTLVRNTYSLLCMVVYRTATKCLVLVPVFGHLFNSSPDTYGSSPCFLSFSFDFVMWFSVKSYFDVWAISPLSCCEYCWHAKLKGILFK